MKRPIDAAAITIVDSQPNQNSDRGSVKLPITFGLAAMIIITTKAGTATTPFSTAAKQLLDRIEMQKRERKAYQRAGCDRGVETFGVLRLAFETGRPIKRFAHSVGRRAREHRDGEHAGAHDAGGE